MHKSVDKSETPSSHTQHALRLPSVVVPGLDTVLDVFGDAVGGHVLNGVVHARAVVRLTRSGCADHVAHLDAQRRFSLLAGRDPQRGGVAQENRYLSDHDGEGEDSDKVVDELKDDLEEGGRVRQASDGDQRLHSKVVTADVTEAHAGKRDED